MRVQTLERERLEGDEQVSKLKETVASQNREVSDLLAQVRFVQVFLTLN